MTGKPSIIMALLCLGIFEKSIKKLGQIFGEEKKREMCKIEGCHILLAFWWEFHHFGGNFAGNLTISDSKNSHFWGEFQENCWVFRTSLIMDENKSSSSILLLLQSSTTTLGRSFSDTLGNNKGWRGKTSYKKTPVGTHLFYSIIKKKLTSQAVTY